MIQFDESVCRNLEAALHREWLETNGLGGYASSTIAGLNTRRYHGLLVAATKPPVGRMVLLSKLEETLIIGGRRHELSANRYPGVVHPQGYLYLKQFRLDPFPVFVYQLDDYEFEKTVFMPGGENSTVIQYALRAASGAAAESITLELRPLIAFRDHHCTTHENGALDPSFAVEAGCVKLTPYHDLPPLYLHHSGAQIQKSGCWYRNFEYDRERERGLDWTEDLFNPCVLVFDCPAGAMPAVVASTELAARPPDAAELRANEHKRRNRVLEPAASSDPFFTTLARAAAQFVVHRGDQSTVIAGYHWFTDWGRDTMISLPGLTLATGHPETARSILLAYADHVNWGMVPNRFPDAGQEPEYNTADATLWFFEAVRALIAHTGDLEFVRSKLYEMLRGIIAWHERGTRYGIRVDADGLLLCGAPGVQLTWMDAKVGDWVVTPRRGKPVEIQALWYNALCVMEDLARAFGSAESRRYQEMAGRAWRTFSDVFWNEAAGCLYDVVNGDSKDASIRPNQILAISLFHRILTQEKARSVLEVVERHLLTPYGLRTLSPTDPKYRGRYEGDRVSRDGAYHQGTVWPWLMGPYITAFFAVNGRSPEVLKQAEERLAGLRRYAEDAGVGQIPEIFDGDAPHRACGCIAQAWSAAELLRVYAESFGTGLKRSTLSNQQDQLPRA
ncbi:MAG TPA: amylo-alpha-1,6-glucosidase [Bryobacteraceae bacterium]|nr:amylo-alpha-1,6-glucosidase [Bryobacteraceae bacterium]